MLGYSRQQPLFDQRCCADEVPLDPALLGRDSGHETIIAPPTQTYLVVMSACPSQSTYFRVLFRSAVMLLFFVVFVVLAVESSSSSSSLVLFTISHRQTLACSPAVGVRKPMYLGGKAATHPPYARTNVDSRGSRDQKFELSKKQTVGFLNVVTGTRRCRSRFFFQACFAPSYSYAP